MKGYSISWYSSDEEQGNPRFAHRSALPCGKKLYLVSTAAIWWLDGLLDLAQLCSLSCLLRSSGVIGVREKSPGRRWNPLQVAPSLWEG